VHFVPFCAILYVISAQIDDEDDDADDDDDEVYAHRTCNKAHIHKAAVSCYNNAIIMAALVTGLSGLITGGKTAHSLYFNFEKLQKSSTISLSTRTMKQVSRCPSLRSGAVLSGLAMSTLAMWCRFVQSRDVSLHNFDGLAMSGLAFSVAPHD